MSKQITIVRSATEQELAAYKAAVAPLVAAHNTRAIIDLRCRMNLIPPQHRHAHQGARRRTEGASMNAQGRKRLAAAIALLAQAQTEISSLGSEEQDKFDGMPEGLQMSERGQKIEECATAMEDAVSMLDDLISDLHSV